MSDFRDQLSDRDLIRFYDLWAAMRGSRAMPSRKDLDPLHVPPEFLPNLMLVDVLRGGTATASPSTTAHRPAPHGAEARQSEGAGSAAVAAALSALAWRSGF